MVGRNDSRERGQLILAHRAVRKKTCFVPEFSERPETLLPVANRQSRANSESVGQQMPVWKPESSAHLHWANSILHSPRVATSVRHTGTGFRPSHA